MATQHKNIIFSNQNCFLHTGYQFEMHFKMFIRGLQIEYIKITIVGRKEENFEHSR